MGLLKERSTIIAENMKDIFSYNIYWTNLFILTQWVFQFCLNRLFFSFPPKNIEMRYLKNKSESYRRDNLFPKTIKERILRES